jgi:Tetratricopeptide repeat.
MFSAPISRQIARTALVGAFLLSLSAINVAPALAEGFPGVGSRTDYADALPHYNLGNRYMAKEWWEKAVEKYNDAINIYPHDPDVYINLGTALRKMQDNAGAEKALRKALELNDKDWVTWSNLGNMIMIQDRFMEALDCFDKAFKCGAPEADRKAMEENIDGIKKILKNKYGIDLDKVNAEKAAKAKADAAKAAKAGKGKGKGKGASPSVAKTHGAPPKANGESSKPSVAANWGYEDAKSTGATAKSTSATAAGAPQREANLKLADAHPKKTGDAPPPVKIGNSPTKETDTGYEILIEGATEEAPDEEQD